MRPPIEENYTKLLYYIAMHKAINGGNAPTIREMGRYMEHKTTSHTSFMLRRLERENVIFRRGGRNITILRIP